MTDISRRDVLLGTGAVVAAAALPAAIQTDAIGNELVTCIERAGGPWPETVDYVLRWIAVPQVDEKGVIFYVLQDADPII